MPGWRISSSAPPAKSSSQMGRGATPMAIILATPSAMSSEDEVRRSRARPPCGSRHRLAASPRVGQLLHTLGIGTARTIGFEVRLRGIRSIVLQNRIGQRSQHRLGMLPADDFEGAECVGDVDDLVADVAEVAAGESGIRDRRVRRAARIGRAPRWPRRRLPRPSSPSPR